MVYGMFARPLHAILVVLRHKSDADHLNRRNSSSKTRLQLQLQAKRRRSLLLSFVHKKVQLVKLVTQNFKANMDTDLEELSLGTTMKTHFPNPDDILNFKLTIDPDEGMYKGGRFDFDFKINQNFPHDPPKVKCTQKIYHPNIDLEGNVCLNILREDWKPVLNLNAVVVGLQVCYKWRQTWVVSMC
jgi:ubiquitin-protein ligase